MNGVFLIPDVTCSASLLSHCNYNSNTSDGDSNYGILLDTPKISGKGSTNQL